MDNPTELDQLKTQVAQLKQQLDELRPFFHINKKKSGRNVLFLQCSMVSLQNPDDLNQCQGLLQATKDGPSLALWGSDNKARVIITAKQDKGSFSLYQQELQLGVHIGMDDDNRPCMGIFDQGKPRAAMKCTDKAGVVTVVHDDGLVRAMMRAEEDLGEITVINSDMKAAVKITSQGIRSGGLITVNHPNGKPAVLLSSLPETGCVFLKDQSGKDTGALPDMNE